MLALVDVEFENGTWIEDRAHVCDSWSGRCLYPRDQSASCHGLSRCQSSSMSCRVTLCMDLLLVLFHQFMGQHGRSVPVLGRSLKVARVEPLKTIRAEGDPGMVQRGHRHGSFGFEDPIDMASEDGLPRIGDLETSNPPHVSATVRLQLVASGVGHLLYQLWCRSSGHTQSCVDLEYHLIQAAC